MLPQNGEGGVIFCEPLLCNSYPLLVHVYLFSYGSLRHVKHMLQPSLLAQENNRIRVRFLRVPCWLGSVRPHIRVRSALASLVRSLHATSFVRQPSLSTTGSRPSDSPRVVINIDRASRDWAYFFYHLPVERFAWAFPYVPPGLYTQLMPHL